MENSISKGCNTVFSSNVRSDSYQIPGIVDAKERLLAETSLDGGLDGE